MTRGGIGKLIVEINYFELCRAHKYNKIHNKWATPGEEFEMPEI